MADTKSHIRNLPFSLSSTYLKAAKSSYRRVPGRFREKRACGVIYWIISPLRQIGLKARPQPFTCHFQSLRVDEHEIPFPVLVLIAHRRDHDFARCQAVRRVRETAVEWPHLRAVDYLVTISETVNTRLRAEVRILSSLDQHCFA